MALTNNIHLLWFVIGYGVLMVILGTFYSTKIKSSQDFILAGKTLGPVVLMGTLLATWTGSGTITGGPNAISYAYGLWPAIGSIIPAVIGAGLLMLIAPKIRAFGKYTISEILETRYGGFAKVLSSIIIILAYVGIVSYQFKGIGFILNITTGISIETGTIIGAVLIIFLATIGGLMAVAPTDALSAFIIVISLIIALPVATIKAGGWTNIVSQVPPDHLKIMGSLTPLQLLGFFLPLLFLMLGDQNMYQRMAASKGDKESKLGAVGWLIGMVIIFPAVSVLAFIARAIFPDIAPGMALISTSLILPTCIGGLLLAAATAFVVTTGNSYLLSAATNVTYDLYGTYVKPNATDKEKLICTKIVIPVLGVISFLLIRFFPTILSVQMYSYTIYGAGITPAVLAVFLWKRVNKAGGLASMIAGMASTLTWEILLKKPFDLNSVVVSVPIAIIVLILVTYMTTSKK